MERSSDGFHIDLDDFLSGLLLLANELVSFTSQYNKRRNFANHNGVFSFCNCYGTDNIIRIIKIEQMILFILYMYMYICIQYINFVQSYAIYVEVCHWWPQG